MTEGLLENSKSCSSGATLSVVLTGFADWHQYCLGLAFETNSSCASTAAKNDTLQASVSLPSRSEMAKRDVITSISKILAVHGYTTHILPEDKFVRVQAYRDSPLMINAVVDPKRHSISAYMHTHIRGQQGSRSDQLLVFSSVLGCFLRAWTNLGSGLVFVDHPVVEGELGDVFVYRTQPGGLWWQSSRTGLKDLERFVAAVRMTDLALPGIVDTTPTATSDCPCGLRHEAFGCEEWARKVASIIGARRDFEHQQRINPTWNFVRVGRYFVVRSRRIASTLPCLPSGSTQEHVIPTGLGRFVVRGEIYNYVAEGDLRKAQRVLNRLESSKSAISVVPLENLTLFFGTEHMLGMISDCGLERFRQEHAHFSQYIRKASIVLFPARQFRWRHIPDDVFEELVYELLDAEPGVNKVRRIGSARDRDAGRDLIAEMAIPSTDPGLEREKLPICRTPVVVQCKSYDKSVGKGHVRDIRDTVEHRFPRSPDN
jgi:hypothetical protein